MPTQPTIDRRYNIWFPAIVGCTLAVALLLGSAFLARSSMDRNLKRTLRSIATVAALSTNPLDIQAITGSEDMEKPEFRKIVDRLNAIRNSGTLEIRYAYILRKTDDPLVLEFVADADALLTDEQLDINGNGEVDETEEASYAGDLYDITDNPALRERAFLQPTTDEEFTIDQWGTLISGYAPIRNAQGEAIAVLGVDMKAQVYRHRVNNMVLPLLILMVAGIGAAIFMFTTLTIAHKNQMFRKHGIVFGGDKN